jgi:pyruvate ferredoxin oxidoreductase delta subunit
MLRGGRMKEEELQYKGIEGIPIIREPGSAAKINRGSWRLVRPVHNKEKCTKCKICYTYCPDAAITWSSEGPKFDLRACKGCMICMEECPTGAITQEKESSYEADTDHR